MGIAVEPRFAGQPVDFQAGEGTRGFLDVLLGVVAFAEGEKLHQLAGEVFVRLLFAAFLQIEVAHHGGVAHDGFGEGAETA